MSPNRREVLAGLGGATLAYALQVGCAPGDRGVTGVTPAPGDAGVDDGYGLPNEPGVEAREWLIVSADGTVTAYTSRTEIGQGLTTVMFDLLSQGLELPRERIRVVLGDTDVCPADGPTTGSAATEYVAWAFWIASHEIKADLVLLAAQALDVPAEQLEYRSGDVVVAADPSRRVGIGELADGRVRRVRVAGAGGELQVPAYVDRSGGNVNAEAIVTGTLQYAGDYHPEGCVYGGFVRPPYHANSTRLLLANIEAARQQPGVVRVKELDQGVIALAESYPALRRALRAMDANWREPRRPQHFDVEAEIRAGAELQRVVEDVGDVASAIAGADVVCRETYMTQFMTQVPMETDTAVAELQDGRVVVHMGTQNPFFVRRRVAEREGTPESQVRVVATPAGGAFGAKTHNLVGEEAVYMTQLTDRPVKYVYSRAEHIQQRSRFKEAVIFDVATAFDRGGRMIARTIDIFQDEGYGTREMYKIANALTRLYNTRVPARHGTMRGTSFVQSIFALESHTDMAARAIGVDALDFRRANVELPAFVPLINHCALALGHGHYRPPRDRGVGFAICNHGGRQLAAVGAEVQVDRDSGKVSVVHLEGAFDIGLVINRRLATNGIKGGMIWGIGAALFEEVELDGHRCHTSGFGDYRIPRMSDTPPIRVAYFDNQSPGRPRGCGEVSVPPTVAAIANAVYDAIGVRFYRLPITPQRVLDALASA